MPEKSKYAKKLMRIRNKNTFSLKIGNIIEREKEKSSRIIDFYNKHPMSNELLRGIPEEELLNVIWEYVLLFDNFKIKGKFQEMIDTDNRIYTKVFLTQEFLETVHDYGFEMLGEMTIINYVDDIVESLVYFGMIKEKDLLESTLSLFNFELMKKKGLVFSEEKKMFDQNCLSENDKAVYKSNVTKIKRSYNKNIQKLTDSIKREINYPEKGKFSKLLKKLSKM